jgi:hypothetical protein
MVEPGMKFIDQFMRHIHVSSASRQTSANVVNICEIDHRGRGKTIRADRRHINDECMCKTGSPIVVHDTH